LTTPRMELAYPINKKSEVLELLRKDGKINNALLEAEVDWFFDKLGMVPNYFMSQSAEVIAQHISIIYANKMVPVQRCVGTNPSRIAHTGEGRERKSCPVCAI